VSFGVAALVTGLGVMFILLGLALLGVLKRIELVPSAGAPPPAAETPAPVV
jgi:hypothetical protein